MGCSNKRINYTYRKILVGKRWGSITLNTVERFNGFDGLKIDLMVNIIGEQKNIG